MKSPDLAPAAKSPRGAAAPSSDSPADLAELSPEPPSNLEPEYQSFPIFCVSRAAPRQIIVPAVRVCRSASRWGVLPLSRQEFGSVWDTQESMSSWVETPLTEGWSNAEQEFEAVIDYPIEILNTLLLVLRNGKFHDGTLVTLRHWPTYCKLDVNKIGVKNICIRCSQVQWFPPRALYSFPRSLSKFCCSDIRLQCILPATSSRDSFLHRTSELPPQLVSTREREATRPLASPERDDRFFTALETFSPPPLHNSTVREAPTSYTTFPVVRGEEQSPRTLPYAPSTFYTVAADLVPFQRHHPLRSYPHPRHFITGTKARALECPSPSSEEVEEYRLASESARWQNLLLALSRWAMQTQGVQLAW